MMVRKLFIVAPLIGMFISTPIEGIRQAAVDEEVTDSIKLTLMAAFFALFPENQMDESL